MDTNTKKIIVLIHGTPETLTFYQRCLKENGYKVFAYLSANAAKEKSDVEFEPKDLHAVIFGTSIPNAKACREMADILAGSRFKCIAVSGSGSDLTEWLKNQGFLVLIHPTEEKLAQAIES